MVLEMIFCRSTVEMMIVDPEDWDSIETKNIGGVDSVLVTVVVDLLPMITSFNSLQ